jgi:hypothetical protein
MIFAKKSGLNEKKTKKNLQVSSKNPKFATNFGIYHCSSPHKNPVIGADIWHKCGCQGKKDILVHIY